MRDPVLIDVPESIQTDRLLLRIPREGDGPGVNKAIVESLDTLRPWLAFAQHAPTLEESEANCRKARIKYLQREDFIYRVYLKGTDIVVGSSGLHGVDWSLPKFEIGYWISGRYERRGFATEAARALADLAIGRLGARRVEIRVDSRNLPSRRIAQNIGFELEGVLRHFQRGMSGELCDMLVFSRVAGDDR